MTTEFEAKFLVRDLSDARRQLEEIGATCVHAERLLRRAVFDLPDLSLDRRGAWVRVRDEGDRVTMSYKQVQCESDVTGTFETILIVDSYDRATELLNDIGMVRKSYQETKRESWTCEGVSFDIDTWPGLPPFMEIEAGDEVAIRRWANVLGFRWEDAFFGGVDVVYEAVLGIPKVHVNHVPEITFKKPLTGMS